MHAFIMRDIKNNRTFIRTDAHDNVRTFIPLMNALVKRVGTIPYNQLYNVQPVSLSRALGNAVTRCCSVAT